MCHEAGARVLAVSDINGGIHNPAGIDIPALLAHYERNRSFEGFPNGRRSATPSCWSSTATS